MLASVRDFFPKFTTFQRYLILLIIPSYVQKQQIKIYNGGCPIAK